MIDSTFDSPNIGSLSIPPRWHTGRLWACSAGSCQSLWSHSLVPPTRPHSRSRLGTRSFRRTVSDPPSLFLWCKLKYVWPEFALTKLKFIFVVWTPAFWLAEWFMELLKRRKCGGQTMCARVFSEGRAEIIVQIEMFANSRFHNFITCGTLPQPA